MFMSAFASPTLSSLSSLMHDLFGFIDTGPGYLATVIAVFLIWLAWRSFMRL